MVVARSDSDEAISGKKEKINKNKIALINKINFAQRDLSLDW